MQNANNKILGISDLSSECNEEIPLVIEGYQFFSNISQVIRNIKLGIANLSVFWVMILPVWYYFRRTVFLILSALSSCIVDMTSRKVFNQFIDRIVYWFTELKQRSCEQNCENDNYVWKSIVITSCFGDKSDWNMRVILTLKTTFKIALSKRQMTSKAAALNSFQNRNLHERAQWKLAGFDVRSKIFPKNFTFWKALSKS